MLGIKLQLRSFSIKRYYSFRPIASYLDASGEETNAHTHAHLFLLKWSVTLSEVACRLPGFQRGKDRITIIGKSIGGPGNVYVHGSAHFFWFKILNFNIFGGFQKNEYFWGVWRLCGYFFGSSHNWASLRVISMQFRVFFKVKVQNWDIFWGW